MFYQILLIMITFIILDIVWFSFSTKLIYEPTIFNIQKEPLQIRFIGGLISWLLLALGLYLFVLPLSHNLTDVMKYGALYGLIIYGIYNGTNYAILNNYDSKIFFPDLIWGIIISTLTSAIAYKIFV